MKVEKIGAFLVCRFDDRDIVNAGKYWTPERVKAAKPVPMPVVPYTGKQKPENVEPLPTADANLSVLPYKCGGRLTFMAPSGDNMYGSAQFFGQSDIVLTAAHCVYDRDTKHWNNQFSFFQAYDDEDYKKRFSVKATAILVEYAEGTGADASVDYGFIVTTDESTDGVLSYNLTLPASATSFGYPSNFKKGYVMQTVIGDIVQTGPRHVSMDRNPYHGGCSGGAWTDAQNCVVGVNATRYLDFPCVNSPLLNADFESLYNFVVAQR